VNFGEETYALHPDRAELIAKDPRLDVATFPAASWITASLMEQSARARTRAQFPIACMSTPEPRSDQPPSHTITEPVM
jgi:hypothetical protein